jgi:type III secretory pathway component EscU
MALDAATIGIVMSCIVSCLAVADYCMKIHWKLKQIRRSKAEAKKAKDEATENTDRR